MQNKNYTLSSVDDTEKTKKFDVIKDSELITLLGRKSVLSVLKCLEHNGACRYVDIYNTIDVSKGTLYNNLENLVDMNLVVIKLDGRRVIYELSDCGRQILNEVNNLINYFNENCVK
ncbi:MarR family winged helix-turn-helix transcriptional regulator [Methanococcus voltae]|uniref:Transcriptional regulator n=2 Tax=Methanococcus voltae TaxID=2188 RepID=A0ABT2EVF9_METVO|nr:MarR family winged helix-turn-helix transcriptional regulator [Methanococcus voltae]MBP2171833.1 putative transcriptional regulator [Methanococcus voltae]MBP2201212.1 putative transcriptional regulator [Methanococcus voltae]MCS3921935.1 putative transcriptional regulator [Methanococcus voltae PS]